jgi:hypothetical protein
MCKPNQQVMDELFSSLNLHPNLNLNPLPGGRSAEFIPQVWRNAGARSRNEFRAPVRLSGRARVTGSPKNIRDDLRRECQIV